MHYTASYTGIASHLCYVIHIHRFVHSLTVTSIQYGLPVETAGANGVVANTTYCLSSITFLLIRGA